MIQHQQAMLKHSKVQQPSDNLSSFSQQIRYGQSPSSFNV